MVYLDTDGHGLTSAAAGTCHAACTLTGYTHRRRPAESLSSTD